MSSIESSISGLIAAQRGAVGSAIGYAVAAKQLDALQQQGDAATQLLETAVQLSKVPDKGGHVNAQA